MAALAELVVALVGDTGDFEQKMSGAGASLQSLGSQMTSVGASLTAGVSLPLLGVGTAAIAMATQFNSGMANISSLSDEARSRVEQWGPAVQNMAISVGQGTSNLNDGLYQVVSAFGATDDSLAILEINAVAAAAGLATTSEAIGLTSAVTRAYGDTSATAVQQVADLAQQAVSMGQTTFPELAGSIGAVAPLASNLGVSMESLFAAMATGAGVTGSTGEVATQLRGILQSLMAPTDSMSQLMGDLGFASGQAMIEGLGLQGTIQAIVGAAQSSGAPLQSYIGSIEGQTLALALAGPQADTFAGNLTAMGDAAGASQSAFEAQTQGVNATGFAMQQAAVQVQVWGQQLGQALMPALQGVMTAMGPVVDFITRLIAGFASLSPTTQMIIIGILGFAAALGPILVVLGAVVGAIGTLVAAFSAGGIAATILGGAIAFLTGPIGIVIAAVVALAAAWATNFMGIREKTAEVWTAVQALIAPVIAWIQTTIQTVIGAVVAWWNTNWPLIQTTIQTVWSAVQTVIQTAVGIVQTIVQTVVGGLITWWNAAWPQIQSVVVAVWGGIQTAIQTAVGIIGPIVTQVIEVIRGAFANAGPIVEQFKALWASLGPLFQALAPVVQAVGTVIGVALGVLGAAFMAVVGVVVGVVQGIASALQPLIQTVMSVVQAVIGVFQGLITFFTGMWNTIVGLFTGNSQLVQQGMQQMGEGIQTIWTNLVNGVVSLVSGFVNTIVAFVSGLVDGVITFFTNLYQTLVGGSIVPDMVNAIVGWFEQLSAFLQAIVAAIQAFIEAAWQALLAVTTAIWEGIKAFIESAITTVQSIITAVVSAVQAFWQATWSAIQAFTQALWAAMQALIQAALSAIQNIIQSVWSAVQGFWQSTWTAIQSFTQAVWAAMQALIQAALSAIQNVVMSVVSAIQSLWQSFMSTLQTAWQTAWQLITNIIETAKTTLTNIAQSIVSAIFAVFNVDWGAIGRNIVDSIGNALRAGLQWVADQARRIAEAALQAALDALGIGSPSKEFMYLGEMSVAGFAGAFDDVRPVERAVVRAIDGALGAGSRAAGSGGGSVDRSVRIGQVMIPGASGMSVLEQMRAYGR